MATIPRSPGQRVMPGDVPVGHANPAAFGGGSARAMEQFGGTLTQVGFDIRQDQMREEQRAAEERKRVAEAAEKAKELDQLNKTQDALTDARDELMEGLRTGAVDKTQVESLWTERSKKIASDAMGGFRDQTKPLVQGQIERLGMRYGNDVRKAVTIRDKQDVTAGIDQTLEFTQRQYKTDPAAAQAQAMATLDQLGSFSLYTPQEIAAKKQAWKEGTQFTTAFEAISAGRNNRQALDGAAALLAKMPDLDPQKRATLTDRIDAYRMSLDQKAELAAQRAQREWERREQKAAAALQSFQAQADMGTALNPAYIDQALQDTAGFPQQAAIRALAEQAKITGGLAAQPIREQQAILDAIDRQIAQKGRTPELTKRREQIEKVAKGSRDDVENDAMRAGLERGVITDLKPIDFSGGVPGIIQQVQMRVQSAERVGTWAGRPVSPLTADEADVIAKQFDGMKAQDKANAVAMLASQVPGPQMLALAKQMAPKNRGLYLGMALGADRTTAGLPAARLVFMGQDFLRNEGKSDNKLPADVQKRVSEVVGDMFTGQLRDDIVETATLIQLGKKLDGQSQTARTSVELALGGPIIQHAGQPLPAAPGMTLDKFRSTLPAAGKAMLARLPDGKAYASSGEAVDGAALAADLPFSQLLPAGQGRYFVRLGSGVAMNAKGEKLVLEIR